jgi:hypothetical protein
VITIYEQGGGRGIGLNVNSFIDRFDQICEQHKKEGRAKSFAFIFYDFNDDAVRAVLKDHGVFTKLDRLTGNDLSIFYLHAYSRESVERFNTTFSDKLGITVTPPCVCFFKLEGKEVKDVSIAQLDNTDLIHAFPELYSIIETYIKGDTEKSGVGTKAVKWGKAGGKFVTIEGMRGLIRQGIEALFS